VAAFLASGTGLRIAIDVVLTALAGALLVVPAFTAVQSWAGEERRARVIAAVNVVSALFMVVGSLVTAVLQAGAIGVSQPALLVGLGLLNVGAGVYFFRALPGSFVADALNLILRICCRLEVAGARHLTEAGDRAIIAVEHGSRLDALIIFASLAEKPLFVVDQQSAMRWWAMPFRSFCIGVEAGKPGPLRRLIREVENGRRAVVFLDGRLTSTATLPKAYAMAAFVANQAEAKIVAARLDGLERPPFALRPAATARLRLFPKVRLTFDAPHRAGHSLHDGGKRHAAAGAAVHQLMTDLAFASTPLDRTLIEALAETAKRNGWGKAIIADPFSGALSARLFLVAAAVLARKIMGFTEPGECVGLLLPNVNATIVTFFAVQAAGRAAAMLNYTAGGANMRAACAAACVRSVLTSRAFVEKADLHALVAEIGEQAKIIYLEDMRDSVGALDKLRGSRRDRKRRPRASCSPIATCSPMSRRS
jgi:acyl-[acyl-carrier-protein]-phospholipid O-acyltransferase/long-chain-fatty-acid--[acyl-carrier-protein] ligase